MGARLYIAAVIYCWGLTLRAATPLDCQKIQKAAAPLSGDLMNPGNDVFAAGMVQEHIRSAYALQRGTESQDSYRGVQFSFILRFTYRKVR